MLKKLLTIGLGSWILVSCGGEDVNPEANSQNEEETEVEDLIGDSKIEGYGRYKAATFVLNGKGYLVGGRISPRTIKKDFWEYDPVQNVWTQLDDFPAAERNGAISFVADGLAYIGGGDAGAFTDDMFAFDAASKTWSDSKSPYPDDINNSFAVAEVIDGIAYVGFGGTNVSGTDYFYQYNPSLDEWTWIENDVVPQRRGAVSFVLNGQMYIGLGYESFNSSYNDFYKFDPSTKSWTKLNDFPGEGRGDAISFVLDGEAYVGTGFTYTEPNNTPVTFKDIWKYNLAEDSWTQVADYDGNPRYGMSVFVIEDVAYLGMGYDSQFKGYNNFYKYTKQ